MTLPTPHPKPSPSLWSRKPFVALRVLGKRGQYPGFEIRTSTHLYVPGPELVWTAVLQPALPVDWELAEWPVLVPEEVRLLSAITLCEPDTFEKGLPIVAHWHAAALWPEEVGLDLLADDTVRRLESVLAGMPREADAPEHGDVGYHIRSDLGSRADAVEMLANIDTSDQLLLAGLSRLLGASRLISVAHELEEGAISLFISMGAALEYIRLWLAERSTTGDASYADVSAYFATTFPMGQDLAEYFDEMHEHRVIAMHPASRFGEFWTPPLMTDDVYHLRKSLMGLYRHILLGAVDS